MVQIISSCKFLAIGGRLELAQQSCPSTDAVKFALFDPAVCGQLERWQNIRKIEFLLSVTNTSTNSFIDQFKTFGNGFLRCFIFGPHIYCLADLNQATTVHLICLQCGHCSSPGGSFP